MATYKCDVCGEATDIYSRYRGAYCRKHWNTAQAVEPSSKLINRMRDGMIPVVYPNAYTAELDDLKAKIIETCEGRDK